MDTLRDKNKLEELWKNRMLGRYDDFILDKKFWENKKVLITGHNGKDLGLLFGCSI